MSSYNTHTIPQLKALLRDRKLPVSGRNATLVQRLEEDDASRAQEESDDSDVTDADQQAEQSGGQEPEGRAASKDENDELQEDSGDDYRPQENDSGDEEDESNAPPAKDDDEEEENDAGYGSGDLLHSDVEEEGDDFIEVEMQDGTIERIAKPDGLAGETTADEFERGIQSDPIYNMLNERRKLRLSVIILTGEANAKLKNQMEIDVSDSAPTKKFPPKTVRFIPCTAGRFIEVSSKGRTKFKEMTDDEMKNEQGNQKPCECQICTKRRHNNETFGEGELRSGKKRGWTKYGVGRVLGGGGERAGNGP
ncbi:hypothetical protein VE02_06277 [Pseudogymnoascus sp. 03VT05]|nr:hypothetical protein VE02_06277 [Pseudogymnoascus sp. 03VT05]